MVNTLKTTTLPKTNSRSGEVTPAKNSMQIKSLDHGLRLLEILSEQSSDISNKELSEIMGMHPSSIYRLLSTLRERNYVYQNPITKGYQLGVNIIHLGEAAKRRVNLVNMANSAMNALADSSNLSVCLNVLAQEKCVLIHQAILSGSNPAPLILGSQTQLYASASGKCLLSFSPPDFIEAYLSKGTFEKYTWNTISDSNSLRIKLDEIRKNGYAIDDEEVWLGVQCIAAPIWNYAGKIEAVINVVGSTSNQILGDQFEDLKNRLIKTASIISSQLGYQDKKNQ
ncbi:IclR family transcriptional regulator [Chloroflexota bacterium]